MIQPQPGKQVIPNSITLGINAKSSIMLLTGPNMGGKSTLLRQVTTLTYLHFLPHSRSLSPGVYSYHNGANRVLCTSKGKKISHLCQSVLSHFG